MSENKIDYFVVEYKNVINPILCKEIINLFELDNNKLKGQVLSGVLPKVKNTLDLNLDNTNPLLYSEWFKINELLKNQLDKYVNKYYKTIETNIFNNSINFFQYDFFIIQKYIKNEGIYTYHNDFNYETCRYRLITFIFYLNSIDHGGETEFKNGKYKIKPEQGKLLLFPASWTYPHCGKTPYSEDKYIITGWLYSTDNNYVINKINNIYNSQK